MLNDVKLIGRLGAEPVEKKTGNGNVYAEIVLYVDRPYAKENQQSSDVFRVMVWGKSAQFVLGGSGRGIKKGDLVMADGRINIDRVPIEGTDKYNYYTKVNTNRLTLLRQAGDSSSSNSSSNQDSQDLSNTFEDTAQNTQPANTASTTNKETAKADDSFNVPF